MKIKELRATSSTELKSKLEELKKELMKIKAQAKVSTPKSPGKIKFMKKTISRIVMLLESKHNASINKNKGGTSKI